MKRLVINIDGIIRDFLYQFDTIYRKHFIHNESLVDMNEDMTVKLRTEQEEEELQQKIEKAVRNRITLPVDTFDLLNHYKFEEKKGFDGETVLSPREHLEQFIHEERTHHIFAQAPEFEKAMETVNKIQQFGIVNGLFETALVAKLKSKSITATLFFLSKVNCRVKNIHFVDEDYQKWDHADVLVDISPESLQNKPEGKVSIKINHPANQWDEADYSFESIKSLYNPGLLNKIFLEEV